MNLPNKITITRILLIPIFIACYFLNLNWASLVIFVITSGTDWLDGFLARKLNQITTFGKFMDPIADKLLTITALILFIPLEPIFFSIAIIIIFTRDFMVDGFRSIAASKNIIIPANMWGKYKTVSQMLAISVILLGLALSHEIVLTIGCLILIIAVILTIISGVIYIVDKWKEVMNENIN